MSDDERKDTDECRQCYLIEINLVSLKILLIVDGIIKLSDYLGKKCIHSNQPGIGVSGEEGRRFQRKCHALIIVMK